MLTIGQIRILIKNMPDDALVLQYDSFSEFAYDMFEVRKCYQKIDHISNDKTNYYDTFDEKEFECFLQDNSEETEKLNKNIK